MTTPKARFEITADDKTAAAFKSALNQGKKFSGEMKSVLSAAFVGISMAGITAGIAGAIELGDEMGKLAIKTGLTATAASELSRVFQQNDLDTMVMTTAFKNMQVELSKGGDGFKKLGLSVDDLRKKRADEVFEIVAQRISELSSANDRAAASADIFGAKIGGTLLPMFNEGAEGIRRLRRELGGLTEDDVAKLQAADDAIKKLEFLKQDFWNNVALGAVSVAEAFGLIAESQDKLLGKELNDALRERKDILTEIQTVMNTKMNSSRPVQEWGTAELRDLGKELAAVEARISKINEQGLSFDKAKEKPKSTEPDANSELQDISTSGLSEVSVTSQRISAYEELLDYQKEVLRYEQLISEQQRKTASDVASAMLAAANDSSAELQEMANNFDEFAQKEFDETAGKMVDIGRLSTEKIQETSEFAKEAARSIYSAFSDAFYNLGSDTDTFAEDMINAFKRVLANAATTELFEMLANLGDSMSSDGSSSTSSTIGSFLSAIFTANAKGNAFGRSGLITAFANGGVVSSATPFAYAGGVGVMGEAGDEAIMPLSRGSDGKLGVKAQGSGAGTPVSMTQHNNFYAGADKDLRSSMPSLLKQTQQAAVAEILDMKRRGKL